ncbi:MAG: nucleotide sugar dehydrogenase [Methanoregula sp.]|nr:nucleotide sugar dehydrogenase [Methanoregula sp.]
MILEELIKKRGPIKKIGVIGMGYVGIPAAALFADSPKFQKVYGFQRDSSSSGYKIAILNRGESPLKGVEPGLEDLLKRVVAQKKFECTSDFSKIARLDAVTLAIQTPFLNKDDLLPDFSALEDGIRQVGRHLQPGMLVVLESTVTPGTTTGLAREILELESGLVAGRDFGLVHAPERVMVGRLIRNIREHDRIVGGIDTVSTQRAAELYSAVLTTGKVIPMTATAAEVTKTAENTFRDLQIAAINELALYCEAMGINVYDVRTGIDSLKGEGITRSLLWPGAGVGGHCLTKDTYHLERGVQVLGKDILDYPKDEPSLFIVARRINDFMPKHMHRLTLNALARVGCPVNGAKVTILGWAFLSNTDDARNTPSEPFRDDLIHDGAIVSVHDPYVTEYAGVPIKSDIDEAIRDADAIVIFAGHHQYRMLDAAHIKMLTGKTHPVIVDGRNLIDPDQFIANGFVYKGIGRGDKNGHGIIR